MIDINNDKRFEKRVYAITGFIGSGKDTIADYLTRYHGFKRVSFAGSLKDAVAAVFGWDRELLEGSTKSSREWREQVDHWWANRLGIPDLTPRWVLQYWGTEVLRRGFHQDIWVASVEHKLLQARDHIVITDCRFPNEVAAVKSLGGTTIRVERGPRPEWYDIAMIINSTNPELEKAKDLSKRTLEEVYKVHPSEYSSVGIKYDFTVDNNGTIDELHNSIEVMLDFSIKNPPAGLPAST